MAADIRDSSSERQVFMKRLGLEDLYVGRRVTYEELRDITDVYIILSNASGSLNKLEGDIAYVTEERDEHSTELILSGCRCIYNDSLDMDEDVTYDE